jgi:hypothetical protein
VFHIRKARVDRAVRAGAGRVLGDQVVGQLRRNGVGGVPIVQELSGHRVGDQAAQGCAVGEEPTGGVGRDGSDAGNLGGVVVEAEPGQEIDDDVDGRKPAVVSADAGEAR